MGKLDRVSTRERVCICGVREKKRECVEKEKECVRSVREKERVCVEREKESARVCVVLESE